MKNKSRIITFIGSIKLEKVMQYHADMMTLNGGVVYCPRDMNMRTAIPVADLLPGTEFGDNLDRNFRTAIDISDMIVLFIEKDRTITDRTQKELQYAIASNKYIIECEVPDDKTIVPLMLNNAINYPDESKENDTIKNEGQIVTIVGPLKFKKDMDNLAVQLSALGYIVYSPLGEPKIKNLFGVKINKYMRTTPIYNNRFKNFDKMIGLSDFVIVYNKDEYIGSHTIKNMICANCEGVPIYTKENVNQYILDMVGDNLECHKNSVFLEIPTDPYFEETVMISHYKIIERG